MTKLIKDYIEQHKNMKQEILRNNFYNIELGDKIREI